MGTSHKVPPYFLNFKSKKKGMVLFFYRQNGYVNKTLGEKIPMYLIIRLEILVFGKRYKASTIFINNSGNYS